MIGLFVQTATCQDPQKCSLNFFAPFSCRAWSAGAQCAILAAGGYIQYQLAWPDAVCTRDP